ncbi:MAG: hypothetical protein QN229_07315 [Desulfurococcaceae archaeon TW002]
MFKNFLIKYKRAEADLREIGINLEDDSTLVKFLEEHCVERAYDECFKDIRRYYHEVFVPEEPEVLKALLEDLNKHFGTVIENEAFKKAFKMIPHFSIRYVLQDWENTPLTPVFNYLKYRFGCRNFVIEPLYG